MPAAVRLMPYTPQLAVAWQRGQLAQHLGLTDLPEAWPTFPRGLAPEHACEPLAQGVSFGPYLFLHGERQALVGNGGFKGAPCDGVVELGYEIAPVHRGQGHAKAAVRALLALAWHDATVLRVQAHTLGHENPSTGVLRACGFVQTDTVAHQELGSLWRWCLKR